MYYTGDLSTGLFWPRPELRASTHLYKASYKQIIINPPW